MLLFFGQPQQLHPSCSISSSLFKSLVSKRSPEIPEAGPSAEIIRNQLGSGMLNKSGFSRQIFGFFAHLCVNAILIWFPQLRLDHLVAPAPVEPLISGSFSVVSLSLQKWLRQPFAFGWFLFLFRFLFFVHFFQYREIFELLSIMAAPNQPGHATGFAELALAAAGDLRDWKKCHSYP